MTIFIYFIFGLIFGGLVAWFLVVKLQSRHTNKLEYVGMSDVSKEAEEANRFKTEGLIEKQVKEKEENRRKILEILKNRDEIANKDVERETGVSDATATRYLDELEKEGVLEQIGRIGTGVYYKKK